MRCVIESGPGELAVGGRPPGPALVAQQCQLFCCFCSGLWRRGFRGNCRRGADFLPAVGRTGATRRISCSLHGDKNRSRPGESPVWPTGTRQSIISRVQGWPLFIIIRRPSARWRMRARASDQLESRAHLLIVRTSWRASAHTRSHRCSLARPPVEQFACPIINQRETAAGSPGTPLANLGRGKGTSGVSISID